MTTLKTLCTTTPKVRMIADYDAELLSQANWNHAAHAWKVTLKYKTRQMSIPFFGGAAVTHVEVHDVMDCLLSDASLADETSGFRDWCENLGHEPDEMDDSDLARFMKMHRECVKAGRNLRRLLGDDYETFMHSER